MSLLLLMKKRAANAEFSNAVKVNAMKKEKKGLLNNKVFYIVFSIVASIALWSYVAYVENPDVTVPINGIDIEFIGEDILTDNELIVTEISDSTLSLNLSGKRNVVTKFTSDNIKITADLGSIISNTNTDPGVYQLEYDIEYPNNVNSSVVNVVSASANYITVKVEQLVDAKIPVRGTYNGNVAEGFQAKSIEFDVEEIKISGPADVVNKVECAWVNLNIYDDITKTIEQESSFVLLDSSGKEVDSDFITMSQDIVVVKIPVLIVKDVPLVVNYADTSVLDQDDFVCNIYPSTVKLSGDAEVLDEINQILIGTIDLTSFATTMTEEFPIVIPNDVNNLTGDTTAAVTVEILNLDVTEVETTNIQVKNIPAGYTPNITTKNITVKIRGNANVLENIDANNIRIVADLSELNKNSGVFSVDAKVFVDGFTNVDVIGSYEITVIMSQ